MNIYVRGRRNHLLSLLDGPPLPQKTGFVKVNFDVSMGKNLAVGAAVLRDHSGLIDGASVQQLQVSDPLEGEVCAAQLGVAEAKRRGFNPVLVEGDSLLIINALRQFPARVDWSIHSRIGDLSHCAADFGFCGFNFVNRDANCVTHHLARWAPSQIVYGGYSAVFEPFPDLF